MMVVVVVMPATHVVISPWIGIPWTPPYRIISPIPWTDIHGVNRRIHKADTRPEPHIHMHIKTTMRIG
jgi:hypothetical protein